MTAFELRRAKRQDVIRLARWLGVPLGWDTTYGGLLEAVEGATR